MIKCVLVLVLLQLCYSFSLDTNLNKEIIESLKDLKTKVRFNSPETAQAPSIDLKKNHTRCVGLYSMELRKLLDNVTVTDNNVSLQPLKDNLEKLGKDEVHDQGCKMAISRNVKVNFRKYWNFFKVLNNHR